VPIGERERQNFRFGAPAYENSALRVDVRHCMNLLLAPAVIVADRKRRSTHVRRGTRSTNDCRLLT
jgi:hypothetical protein